MEMLKSETTWRKNGDWKERYLKLYSSRGLSQSKKEEPRRISFMSNDCTPYASLLMKLRARQRESIDTDDLIPCLTSLMSQRSECYGTRQGSQQSDNLGETYLLDIVRSRSREAEDEVREHPLILPREDTIDDVNINDACVHGLSIRMTDRSASRSRVSRMSTRRDMDIPSILAFTATVPDAVHLGIPAFQKVKPQREEIPRWSIRRSVCPVCSQKWRDRSSIKTVKYSVGNTLNVLIIVGLKRNSSYELPSVIAPARLRTSITMGYTPRNIPVAIDKEVGIQGSLRNTSASWQLTRARRFRIPKPVLPPPEATAPPKCNTPMAQKDLDLRVNRFLSD